MKLVNIAKKFAKPIGFGAAGIAALGVAISSVLNRNQEDDIGDYDPDEDEDTDGMMDEPDESSDETVDDAE